MSTFFFFVKFKVIVHNRFWDKLVFLFISSKGYYKMMKKEENNVIQKEIFDFA